MKLVEDDYQRELIAIQQRVENKPLLFEQDYQPIECRPVRVLSISHRILHVVVRVL